MHTSVLLMESIDALALKPDGVYVDGTFGRGGHSRAILARLGEQGRLIGIDKDPQAIAEGERLAAEDARFSISHGSFAELAEHLRAQGVADGVDGVLLDLGVSSPQLDQAERGFSFLHDGDLDMRMDTTRGLSAAQWLAQAREEDIAQVLKEYGEERFARRMARAIVQRRQQQPITRTRDLADICAKAHPRWEVGKHPATRAFQAIRIHINQELSDLEQVLESVVDQLKPEGRLAVISFHSLEDRIVKRFIRDESRGRQDLPARLPIPDAELQRRLRGIGKAIKPSAAEVADNPRSRSAVLRIAERL